MLLTITVITAVVGPAFSSKAKAVIRMHMFLSLIV